MSGKSVVCETNEIQEVCFKSEKNINLFMKDMISNALINQIEINNKRLIFVDQAEAYIEDVKKDLEVKGYDVTLFLSRNHTTFFEECYSDYFYKCDVNGRICYGLNNEKSIDDLYKKFRGTPLIDVIISLEDNEIVEKHFGLREYKIKRLGK